MLTFFKSKYHRVDGVCSRMNRELFWQNTIAHMWVAIFAFARVFVVYLNFARAPCQWTVQKVKMDTGSQNLYHEASTCHWESASCKHNHETLPNTFGPRFAAALPQPGMAPNPGMLEVPQAFRDSDSLPSNFLAEVKRLWNHFFGYFSWASAYVNLQLWQLGPKKTCLLPTCSLVFYSAWSPTDFLSRTLTQYFFSPTETKPD